jgi:hypothetical protein
MHRFRRSPVVPPALALAALLPALASAGDGPIQDNSFLLEEAYNQEPGVIQHISALNRSSETGAWAYSFTEEWPVLGQTHQASVTFSYADLRAGDDTRGVGDVLLNYRWQAVGSGETPVAFAPRLTAVLPTGDAARGLGNGGAGVEVNLPLSVVLSKQLVSHVNLGGRYVPSAETEIGAGAELASFWIGQSFIWLAHRNLNLMLEAVYSSTDVARRSASARTESLFLNPGIRVAVDVGDLQIVPGVALPIGVGPSRGDNGLFFYLSFEHPFRLAGPTS